MNSKTWSRAAAVSVVVGALLGAWNPSKINAQDEAGKQDVDIPKFQVDPFWPKPLPDRWVTGSGQRVRRSTGPRVHRDPG